LAENAGGRLSKIFVENKTGGEEINAEIAEL